MESASLRGMVGPTLNTASTDAPHGGFVVLVSMLLAGICYGPTAVTGLGFHDAAELALRASELGAAHAPGAPLHTLLAFAASAMVGDAAAGTALLSVVAAVLTSGVLAWLLLALGTSAWTALAGALAYALTYPVWGNAVVVELYALSTLCVALIVVAALRWSRTAYRGFPLALALAYGVALATHFANIILLPAFLVLLIWATGWRDRRWVLFLLIVAACIMLVACANVLLAARVPPFGPFVPDTLAGVLGYMSGAEHAPLRQAELGYFLQRTLEHVVILLRNYLGVGLLFALVGCVTLIARARVFGCFILLLCAAYLGYFTWFGSGDYFTMVAPAYLMISLWLALGADTVARRWLPAAPRATGALVPLALVALSLVLQLQMRVADAQDTTPRAYVENAFVALPENSIVVARWNEFTALSYAQRLDGQRADLAFVVPARTLRHYPHGNVNDYLEFVTQGICSRPVVTNKLTPELDVRFGTAPVSGTAAWLQLQPLAADHCQQGEQP
jgi:hypothetical protein